MIEQVLQARNLNYALQRVKSNKGSAGIDGMRTTALSDYIIKHKESIITSIRSGKYLPQPILGVELSEANHEYN